MEKRVKTEEALNGNTADNDGFPMEERILECAEELFLEKGFALATTTEIARRAGCNQALVHYYFRTKENLFQKIFENKVKHLLSEFVSVEGQGKSFTERLAYIIGMHYDILSQNPKLPLLLVNEITQKPHRLAEIKKNLGSLSIQAFKSLEKELYAEIDKGNVRRIEIIDLVLNIVSLNVFMFLAHPVIADIWNLSPDEMAGLVERRRGEVIRTIIQSLKP